MSLGSLESNLAEMSITERRAPILESKVIQEIFMNDADIYSAEREVRHYILDNQYHSYCPYFQTRWKASVWNI